jgi:hypothetical protein
MNPLPDSMELHWQPWPECILLAQVDGSLRLRYATSQRNYVLFSTKAKSRLLNAQRLPYLHHYTIANHRALYG